LSIVGGGSAIKMKLFLANSWWQIFCFLFLDFLQKLIFTPIDRPDNHFPHGSSHLVAISLSKRWWHFDKFGGI